MTPQIHMGVNEATKNRTRYPAPVLDRFLHLARHFHDGQCRCVVTFSGRLDTERIARAVELTLDAEPVLGSRFVAHPWRPYWERLPNGNPGAALPVLEIENGNSTHSWLLAPLDASTGMQVRAGLFREPQEILALKLSHEACDAVGLLDYLGLVSSIYRELRTNPTYIPRPEGGRPGQGAVLRNIGLRELLRGCLHLSWPSPGIDFTGTSGTPGVPAFASRNLDADSFARVREYSSSRRVSVNEVLLAAFYRAQFRLFSPPSGARLSVPVAVDLRRYLPMGSTWSVCNLAAVFFTGTHDQELDTMVTDMRRQLATIRSDKPWLGQIALAELIFLLPYALVQWPVKRLLLRMIASGRVYPYMTNLGVIDSRRLDFGDAKVSNVELYGPMPLHPLPILAVYTVGDRLSAAISVRDQPNGQRAERLLEAFFSELPGNGSPATSQRQGAA